MTALPARSLDEAYEYLALDLCACGTGEELATYAVEVTPLGDDTYRLSFACPGCGTPRGDDFRLMEPPNGPGAEFAYGRTGQLSQLIDVGGWIRVTVRHYFSAHEILSDLVDALPDDELLVLLVRSFVRAAAAAEEALRYLPDGAERVPDRVFVADPHRPARGPMPRPERFTAEIIRFAPKRSRQRLTELIAGYQNRRGVPGGVLERLCGEVLPYGTRHVGEPFPARTLREASAYTRSIECRCGSDRIDLDDSTITVADQVLTRFFGACADCGRPREYLFRNVGDDHAALPWNALWSVDERPSQLFDASYFIAFWDTFTQAAAGFLRSDPVGRWYQSKHYLQMAASSLDEALKFVPPGADRVPEGALRTPEAIQTHRAGSEFFGREFLERERDLAWQRVTDFLAEHPEPADDDDDGDGPPGGALSGLPRPRSAAERRLYFDLRPCECGASSFTQDELTVVPNGAEYAMRYAGTCVYCGRARRFEVALSEELTPAEFVGWAPGNTPSQIFDAGQWLLLAHAFSGQAVAFANDDDFHSQRVWMTIISGHAAQGVHYLLIRSAAAVDEVLKFLPPGADRVPDSAFWTDAGNVARRELPDRFTRAALEAERQERWQRLAGVQTTRA
jgi:hypothetical protein